MARDGSYCVAGRGGRGSSRSRRSCRAVFRDEACCGAHHLGSILLERGIVVPQGRRSLLEALAVLSSEPDGSRVGTRVQRLLDDMLDQWRAPYGVKWHSMPPL